MYKLALSDTKYKTPVFKKNIPDDSFKYQPLPKPSGKYPYHMDLTEIVDDPPVDKMVFHMVGDTGSVRNPSFQKLVVAQMLRHFKANGAEQDDPQFLYHLGDVVYNFGEASAYKSQFFLRPTKSTLHQLSQLPEITIVK